MAQGIWFVSHFFARCASQKTHGDAKITRKTKNTRPCENHTRNTWDFLIPRPTESRFLLSTILVYFVWPWLLGLIFTCAIRKRLLKSHILLFSRPIQTYNLVVKASRTTGCWNFLQPLGHFGWHWTCRWTDTQAFILLWIFLPTSRNVLST